MLKIWRMFATEWQLYPMAKLLRQSIESSKAGNNLHYVHIRCRHLLSVAVARSTYLLAMQIAAVRRTNDKSDAYIILLLFSYRHNHFSDRSIAKVGSYRWCGGVGTMVHLSDHLEVKPAVAISTNFPPPSMYTWIFSHHHLASNSLMHREMSKSAKQRQHREKIAKSDCYPQI